MEIKDVEKLADLARLNLNEEEKAQLLKDMDGILGYIKNIESVDIKDIDIKHDVYNVWREDTSTDQGTDPKDIIDQFPNKKGDFLKVKKIL